MRGLFLQEIGRPEDLSLSDISEPKPGPSDILVDVHAAAVNFPDILSIAGKYQLKPQLPFVPGREAAGVVCSVGESVSRFKTGDRVMVQVDYGAFAEKVLAKEHEAYFIPDGIAFDQAAAVGVAFQTAWFSLTDRARIKEGEAVLITGATGSVGIAATQLASTWNCRVLAGLTTPSKASAARKAGADLIIDLSTDNPREDIREQVMRLTGGEGVDVVLDTIGGDVFSGAMRCLRFRGRMVVVGFTSGLIPEMKTNYLLLKNIEVSGVDRTQYRDVFPTWMDEAQAQIFDYIKQNRIKMPIQAEYPLEEFLRAFDVIRERKVEGKVVLRLKND